MTGGSIPFALTNTTSRLTSSRLAHMHDYDQPIPYILAVDETPIPYTIAAPVLNNQPRGTCSPA